MYVKWKKNVAVTISGECKEKKEMHRILVRTPRGKKRWDIEEMYNNVMSCIKVFQGSV
jgi:hypothetical protein